MKSTNITHSINSYHSNNIINVKCGNHDKIVINKTLWINWIKDNGLSTVLNSNGNLNEKEIQELYSASRHHTAGALNQNLSIKILKVLGILVQEKIERNQNPENCAKKKKLIIYLGKTGYGSQLNFIAMALHEALYAGISHSTHHYVQRAITELKNGVDHEPVPVPVLKHTCYCIGVVLLDF